MVESSVEETTQEKYFEISTIEELEAINNDLTAKYKLIKDLDFKQRSSYQTDEKYNYYTQDTNADGKPDNNWTPIGSVPFEGKFDGDYHTIHNLCINNSTTSYEGLFGQTKNATLKNLKLVNVNIATTGRWVGGFIGNANSGTIERIYVQGSISGGSEVGGIVGATTATISECFANVNIQAPEPVRRCCGFFGNLC